ncbi:MAG: hypothetical protein NUV67_03840 [archaeon]|nr:hypothetical protein [archaeon]
MVGFVFDEVLVAKVAGVALGIIIEVFIVYRLSKILSRPHKSKEEVQKEKEDREFDEIIEKKDTPLEDLKQKLVAEKIAKKKGFLNKKIGN